MRQKGFTLIEVMVAIAILSLMMVVGWSVSNSITKAKKQYGAQQDRWREARLALSRMSRDFEMAYLSGNEDRTRDTTRTFFSGEAEGGIDKAQFSTFAHTPLYADANESDQTIISYAVASSREDRSRQDLMRRETRRLPSAEEKWDQVKASNDTLLSGIKRFKLEYYDFTDKSWKDSWSTQNTDGRLPRPPDRVRVTIVLENELKEEVTFTTQVRIHMQELIQSYAN